MKKAIVLAVGTLVDEIKELVDEVVADAKDFCLMIAVLFMCGSGESIIDSILSLLGL